MILAKLNTSPRLRFIRFCVVGGVGFSASLVLMVIWVECGHLSYLAATALTWLCGNLMTFYLNKSYTFQKRGTRWWFELLKYFMVMGASLGLTLGLMAFLLNGLHMNYIVATTCLSVLVMVPNYLLHLLWSFK